MRFFKDIVILMTLSFSLISKAEPIPQFIINDLIHEIYESDYISLNNFEKIKVINELQRSNSFDDKQLVDLLNQYFPDFVYNFFKDGLIQKVEILRKNNLSALYPANIKLNQRHSLTNINEYTKNRIGPGTFDFIKFQKAKVFVVGGDKKYFSSYLSNITKLEKVKFLKIPSFYEAWGLSKYLIPNQQNIEVPIIIWIVPPAIRYVRHYSTLFNIFSQQRVISAIDENSVVENTTIATSNVNRVLDENQIDYVAFGYKSAWLKNIESNSFLTILNKTEFSNLNLGVGITVLRLKNNISKKEIQLALFSSEYSVWGETAALHLKAFLNPKLKGVIFLGSAGSTDNQINPYDVSIPQSFVRPGFKSKIKNFLTASKNNSDVRVHLHSRHGNTFSPIQQTRKYLISIIKDQINTIDVEQSLVADEVQKFNEINHTDIKFGAVNVITDKPYGVISDETSEHNLDTLNYEKKQKAREMSVSIALNSIFLNEINYKIMSCFKIFN